MSHRASIRKVLTAALANAFIASGCSANLGVDGGLDLEPPEIASPEKLYLFSAADIELAESRVASGDETFVVARDAIVAEAERMLELPIVTIIDGKEGGEYTAPSGDPRDYVSLSPYWWPDPEKADGLPYIRKDGLINPDRANYDADKLGDFGERVRGLAMGYMVTGDERFAERAAEYLRAWFVNPETRMVPRMQFGQFVPGRSEGRKSGIIETNRIRFVADSIGMLQSSAAWTSEDDAAARQWYGEYLDWLLTSELGIAEGQSENNHGTWYHTQAAQYALVSGHEDVARTMCEEGFNRIEKQIEPDGSQPHELTRTVALDYTCFNLRALSDMAVYGSRVGVDLFSHETEDGRSIHNGISFALPFVIGREEWPYQQIKPTRLNMYNQLFRIGALQTGNDEFVEAIHELPELETKDQWMVYFWPATD